jgi:hypothetical protein
MAQDSLRDALALWRSRAIVHEHAYRDAQMPRRRRHEHAGESRAFDLCANELEKVLTRAGCSCVPTELLHRADSYLSLLWHRHVRIDAKADADLVVNVERTIGDLRRIANGGK